MKYHERKERLREHLRSASCLERNMSRLQTAYWIELDAIIDLADYGVEWDMIEKILYDIASFHGSFDEAIEHNLEKLLRQTKAAGGVRSPRRAWLRD